MPRIEDPVGSVYIYRDFAEESRNFFPGWPAFLEKTRAWINSDPRIKCYVADTTYALKEASDYDLRLR